MTAKTIKLNELKDPVVLLAVGFGSGLSPWAPGTSGTLAAILFYFLMQNLTLPVYAAITLAVIIFGSWVCGYATRKLGVDDHPGVVIDEFAGFFVTMFAVPEGWQWLLAGFLLFRFFDAVKPWPISWLDKNVKGGRRRYDRRCCGWACFTGLFAPVCLSGVVA